MLINRTNFILKDGRTAVIRAANPDNDTEEIINLLKTTAKETKFLTHTEKEVEKITIKEEREWLNKQNNSDTKIFMICEVDNQIVGTFGIEFYKSERKRHLASVGIQVASKYWNLGIGTKFFELGFEMIKHLNKKLVELSVHSDNTRAINLYKKMGFSKVATIAGELIMENDEEKDVDIMIKKLKPNPKDDKECFTRNIHKRYHEVDEFVCEECGIHLEDWSQVEIDEDTGEETHFEYVLKYCPECGRKIIGDKDE